MKHKIIIGQIWHVNIEVKNLFVVHNYLTIEGVGFWFEE